MKRLIDRLPRLGVVVALTILPGLLLPGLFALSLLEFARLRGRMPDSIANFGEVHVKEDELVQFFLEEKLRRLADLPDRARALDVALEGHTWQQDSLRLELPRASRAALEADLPKSGEAYQRAHVLEHGTRAPIMLRHRGNTIRHWLYARRSIKVRSKKKNLIRGRRELNMTIKEPYRLLLALEVAKRCGLLVPKAAPLRVFVNGRYLGLTAVVEEVDEGFLLNRHLLPGNVFKGENWHGTNEYNYGSPGNWLFRDPTLWGKKAVDNTLPEHDMSQLEELIRLTVTPEDSARSQLAELIDRETLIRHWAYKLLLGDFHQGGWNNQKWYLNPADGRFYPIVWDPMIGDSQLNFVKLRRVHRNHPFGYSPSLLPDPYHRLGADPHVVHAVLEHAARQLPTRKELEELGASLRAGARRYEAAEPAGEPNPVFTSPQAQLESGLALLLANWDRLQVVVGHSARLEWSPRPGSVWIASSGLPGARLRSLSVDVAQLPSEPPVLDLDRDGKRSPPDRLAEGSWEASGPGKARFLFEDAPLILPAYTGLDRLQHLPLAHPILLPPGCEASGASGVNGISGGPIEVLQVSEWAPEDVDSIHPWSREAERGAAAPAIVTLPTPVARIEQDLEVRKGQTLRVLPGTRVVLSPGVNVVCRGRLMAEGSAEAPIRWEGSDPEQPWGVLALQGPGATGSRLRHVSFRGGSQARIRRVRYPGMVDLHRVEDVRIEACSFSRNRIGDDSLRLAHSQAEIVGCLFEDVPGDALDMDYSRGLVQDCVFRRVGNDGVDLMRSSPRVLRNQFLGCQDKGISIGEGSEPLVADSILRDCAIGIQVKDSSEPLLLHLEIRDSKVGVLASRKNWRYVTGGGGWLANSVLSGNLQDLQVEGDSRLRVTSCRVGPTPTSPGPRLALDRVGPEVSEPDSSPLFSLSGAAPERIGPLGRGASAWRRRRVLREDRFPDGFRLVNRGWSSGGAPSYVRRSALVAEVGPNGGLELARPDPTLPEKVRFHWFLSAARACRVRIELDGARLVEAELGPVPRWVGLSPPGTRVEAIRLVPSTDTKLRLHRYLETAPASQD